MSLKTLQEFPNWCEWLRHNITRQCSLQELKNILTQNEFTSDSIAAEIESILQRNLNQEGANPEKLDFLRLSKPLFTRVDYPVGVFQIINSKLQIYLIPHFLSQEECDSLIAISDNLLIPSTITIPVEDKDFRTSRTANLHQSDSPIVTIIDQKICACLGIEMKYSEHTQLQRYETGEQFKPHTDFFEPNTDEYQKFAHANGNRTWTFMVYLNYVEKGGETLFTAINQKITPKAGLAVIWNNRYTDGNVNYDSLHAGLPVEAGKKFIITKWFRERAT